MNEIMGMCASAMSKYPVYTNEGAMKAKGHGTSDQPVMHNLRWGVDRDLADRICCFNRHGAEHSDYWRGTNFLEEVRVPDLIFTQLLLAG